MLGHPGARPSLTHSTRPAAAGNRGLSPRARESRAHKAADGPARLMAHGSWPWLGHGSWPWLGHGSWPWLGHGSWRPCTAHGPGWVPATAALWCAPSRLTCEPRRDQDGTHLGYSEPSRHRCLPACVP